VSQRARRQAGEGSISQYRTKGGAIRYLVKYTTTLEDGSRKVVLRRRDNDNRPFLTRKAAADYLGDVNAAIRKGVHTLPSNTTVGQWLDQWLAGLRLAPSTMASYKKNVRLHLKPALGQIQLTRLTGSQISGLYRSLERSGRQDHQAGTGLSATTIRYCHTLLKSALSEAVRQSLIAVNPADRATPPAAREAKAQAPEMGTWTGRQIGKFLAWAAAAALPDATAWRVLAFSGARRGEVLALRWGDFDPDFARLSIRRSVGVVHNKGESPQILEGPTKTGRERVVDLDPQTIAALRSWRVARAGLALQLARDDALIFGSLHGEHLHPGRFTHRFGVHVARWRRQLADDAPPMIRLHDLRHSHASLLLAAGVPVKVVSERLGHSTVTITLEIYQHVMPGMQAEAAAKFAAIVGDGV
jgi:integrase